MDTSSRTALKKVFNSITVKTKRRNLKSKRPHSRDFASSAKKFLETRSKRFKLDKDLVNLLVPSSLENTDGLLIWSAS